MQDNEDNANDDNANGEAKGLPPSPRLPQPAWPRPALPASRQAPPQDPAVAAEGEEDTGDDGGFGLAVEPHIEVSPDGPDGPGSPGAAAEAAAPARQAAPLMRLPAPRSAGIQPPMFHGLLAQHAGVRLTQKPGNILLVEADGEEPLEVPCRVVLNQGKYYAQVTLTKLRASPSLWALLAGRYDLAAKQIGVHQLSAIVGRGAVLTGSAEGQVGVHHVNVCSLDNRSENLRTIFTRTHNAWHRHLDFLDRAGRLAYYVSLRTSPGSLGAGLPEELRAAIEADLAALEGRWATAEAEPGTGPYPAGGSAREGGDGPEGDAAAPTSEDLEFASAEDDPDYVSDEDPDDFDPEGGDGENEEAAETGVGGAPPWGGGGRPAGTADEDGAPDPGDADAEATGGGETDPWDATEEGYYPDLGPAEGDSGDLLELAPETVEELLAIGLAQGAPSELELATMHGRRQVLVRLAGATNCRVLIWLLTQGHPALTAGAIIEIVEANGMRMAYDATYLYRYSEDRGCFVQSNLAFEKEVVDFAVQLAEDFRKVRMAASVWPVEDATPALKALPKYKGGNAVVQDCRESLYKLWQAPEPMNSDPWTLNLRNGLLDLRTHELRGHTPDHLSSIQLPYEYDPDAECPVWQAYLKQAVPDEATRRVLQEFLGYCLVPTTKFERALFLYGSGGTGKSTFIKTLRKVVGDENCSAVALDDLNDKFRVGGLRDKLVNLVTEVNPARPLNDARFKAFVSGDPVTGEKKFKDPHVFTPYARFVIAANVMPRVLDQTDAFYRRLIVVRFDQKFVPHPDPDAETPEHPQDPELATKLEEEMPGILVWALSGLRELLARGRFDIPAALQANVAAFREEQDNALRYLRDACAFGPELEVSATDLYRDYVAWCKARGEKPHPNNRFGQVVGSHPGVQAKKSGSKGRHYKGLRPADADSTGGGVGANEGRRGT